MQNGHYAITLTAAVFQFILYHRYGSCNNIRFSLFRLRLSKSKYEVERVRYQENDDTMTSYVLSY